MLTVLSDYDTPRGSVHVFGVEPTLHPQRAPDTQPDSQPGTAISVESHTGNATLLSWVDVTLAPQLHINMSEYVWDEE